MLIYSMSRVYILLYFAAENETVVSASLFSFATDRNSSAIQFLHSTPIDLRAKCIQQTSFKFWINIFNLFIPSSGEKVQLWKGFLANRHGKRTRQRNIAAQIHLYSPHRIYIVTQQKHHLWIMYLFHRFLGSATVLRAARQSTTL